MVILHRQRFRIARFHYQKHPGDADENLAQGLILNVEVGFEEWLADHSLPAEAFLDPGADSSFISLRWIEEQARATGSKALRPKANPNGYLFEAVHLSLGGQRLALGDSEHPVWIARQGDMEGDEPSMPGYEDLLLGRDFITQHGLMVLIDGGHQSFSILDPTDSDNQQRRDQALKAFRPEPG